MESEVARTMRAVYLWQAWCCTSMDLSYICECVGRAISSQTGHRVRCRAGEPWEAHRGTVEGRRGRKRPAERAKADE